MSARSMIQAINSAAASVAIFIGIFFAAAHAGQTNDHYLGAVHAIMLVVPGCNATSPVQIPSSPDLFINRQPITTSGQIAGITGPNDCGGGRSSLGLNWLDWDAHKFSIVKPLLDTSIDPQTHRSRALIMGGPMRGAIIRSAYDADIVIYHGQYLVVFECTLDDEKRFGVDGTSSCIGVYNPSTQSIDLGQTHVLVSGIHLNKGLFYAAAVPELLVYQNRLYAYWSALMIKNGKFFRVAVRGAELDPTANGVWVKGSGRKVVHANDGSLTTEVWAPDTKDQMSNTTVDIRALWVSGDLIIALGSKGGEGCVAPSDKSPGCFRLVAVKSGSPLGKHVFNQAQKVDESELPTNPQEYTRPVRDPSGNYWLCGHFIRPPSNGFSELRPAPGRLLENYKERICSDHVPTYK